MNTATNMLNNQTELTISPRLAKNIRRNIKERVIELILMLTALSAVFTTFAIVAILLNEYLGFFNTVSLKEFFTGKEWTPLFEDAHYGIMPLVAGTLTTSAVALAVAVPLGTIAAIFLSEFASHKTREITKPILELLVGVPTIAFGYFALLFVTPLLQKIYPDLPGFNMLSAGLVMGVMIIPYIASVAEDAMRAVPMNMREGSYAMGATRFQTAIRVVTPAATSGIVAAYILAISRAVGETMVVAVAAGQFEHAVVQAVEAGQGHELEFVAHGPQLALEFGDSRVVQPGLPVERRRAVVGQQLAGMLPVHRLGEAAGVVQIRV